MNPRRLSPPGSDMMGSRFLQGSQQLFPCFPACLQPRHHVCAALRGCSSLH